MGKDGEVESQGEGFVVLRAACKNEAIIKGVVSS